MKLLSLYVGLHSYLVKDSTDSQLSFVSVTGLSGLHLLFDFSLPELWKPCPQSQCCVRWLYSSHIFWICIFFCMPDGDVSGYRWPGDVWSPSASRHSEEQEVGRFEAAVETSGLIWDWSTAWVLQPHLHDEGGIGSSHPKHNGQCTYSEYGPAEATFQSPHFMYMIFNSYPLSIQTEGYKLVWLQAGLCTTVLVFALKRHASFEVNIL